MDWVESRWFGLADLACAALSGALCYSLPGLGGWPLLIALLPWGARLAAGRFPFRRRGFDFPLALFLITAASGVWAAYDRERAWAKFWVIASAVVLYYALASQPRANLWMVAGLASVLGGFIAGYFLLAHNWETLPADIGLLNRFGLWWMSLRPELPLRPIHPNMAGGLMDMLLPFPLAIGLRAWQERRLSLGLFALVVGGLTSAGLLMTSSRAAWFALAAAMGTWIIWGASGYAARWVGRSRPLSFALMMLVVSSLGVWYALTYPGGLVALANKLPGFASGTSRLDLARDTFRLAGDFLFTGGGLGAFSGLYSHYMLIIPVVLASYSHNFLLDVALEQGAFGLLALLVVMLGSAGMLISGMGRRQDMAGSTERLRWAILAGFIVVGLHGLLDDALYGSRSTPLLFFLAGMAVAATASESTPLASPASDARRRLRRVRVIGVATVLAGCAVLLALFHKSVLSSWYADLGAVQMARLELAEWRDGTVNDPGASDLSAAERLFNRALQMDPDNRTAHYRLGLMAFGDRDFTTAAAHLEAVYQFDHSHRGINKVLGYDYVWLGQFDRAASLLTGIPGVGSELSIYAWWWGTQGRDDLAERAMEMAARLDGASANSTP